MAANRLKLNADKTELLWVGSKYGSASPVGSGPPLQLRDETTTASDHVRLLSVTISSDLSTDKHVAHACSACFTGFVRFEGSVVRLTRESYILASI